MTEQSETPEAGVEMDDMQLWEALKASGPLLSEQAVKDCEAGMREGIGIDRRIAHSVAAKCGEQLIAMMEDLDAVDGGPEAMAAIIAAVRRHKVRSEMLADIASKAQHRIELALCAREDFQTVWTLADEMTWPQTEGEVVPLRPV